MKNKYLIIKAFLLCILWEQALAQDIPLNRYGLPVVNDKALYRRLTAADSNQQMVNLQQYIPGIRTDVRYATRNNFTHRVLYRRARVLLRLAAARALKGVQAALREKGYGLKLFDGYRPYSVTEKMWEIVPDDRYAADPRKGSGHNRGVAVDLTIIRLDNGQELPMPTGYDNFTEKAHYTYVPADTAVLANRTLLRTVMEQHGFKALETEWWHFYLPDYERYPLMDLGFNIFYSKHPHKHSQMRSQYP